MVINNIWVGIVPISTQSFSCSSTYPDGSYYFYPYQTSVITDMTNVVITNAANAACVESTNLGLFVRGYVKCFLCLFFAIFVL